jgi:hypothetical protein
VTPKPDPDPEPDPFTQLRLSEEGLAFYNAEKKRWGINDFKIYDYKGDVVREIKTPVDTNGNEWLVVLGKEELTYRGIAIGDDAYEAFLHMNLPKEAVFMYTVDHVTYYTEHAEPFDITRIYEEGFDYEEIGIFFDNNYKPIDVRSVFPLTEKVDACWEVMFKVNEGIISEYSALFMMYALNEDR